jgi:hypothetical protein
LTSFGQVSTQTQNTHRLRSEEAEAFLVLLTVVSFLVRQQRMVHMMSPFCFSALPLSLSRYVTLAFALALAVSIVPLVGGVVMELEGGNDLICWYFAGLMIMGTLCWFAVRAIEGGKSMLELPADAGATERATEHSQHTPCNVYPFQHTLCCSPRIFALMEADRSFFGVVWCAPSSRRDQRRWPPCSLFISGG